MILYKCLKERQQNNLYIYGGKKNMETRKTIEELKNEVLETLKNNDDIFVNCVNELDNWDGFADGFRCFDMSELDDFYCDCKVSKLLHDITSDFNLNDNYFYFSVYGLESCNDVAELYRDKVWESELLDELINKYNHLDIDYIDSDFDKLLEAIFYYDEEETNEE